MKFSINQAVDEIIDLIRIKSPLNLNTTGYVYINPYPNEITIEQDNLINNYYRMLRRLKFRFPSLIPNNELPNYIDWQVRQVYRIINAMMASMHVHLDSLNPELSVFKLKLENCDNLLPLLKAIYDGFFTPPITCSGHGGWETNNGYINFPNFEQNVFLYSPLGSRITHRLGTQIESNRFNKDKIAASTIVVSASPDYEIDSMSIAQAVDYPKQYNFYSSNALPNLMLVAGPDLKARLIENFTGRILFQTENNIYLSEVLYLYPKRDVHWAACSSMPDVDFPKNKIQWDALTYQNQLTIWNKAEERQKRKPIEIQDAGKTKQVKYNATT